MSTEEFPEIMLVEDNSRDAELALRALRKNNLANRVVHVKDGVEALDYIFGEETRANQCPRPLPKVILLDLKLPRLNGLEVLKRLKGDERTNAIPIVMMTSSSEESDKVKSYELGVNSYIVKPVNFHSFSEAVARLGCYWLLLNELPTLGNDKPRPSDTPLSNLHPAQRHED